VLLYKMKLPLSEADLCELLRTARHTYGHGQDVRPPVELAGPQQVEVQRAADSLLPSRVLTPPNGRVRANESVS
jgi:hypothetical protein